MRSFEPKMKKYWFDILIYGLSLGLLLTAIQFFQYKLVFLHGAFDWYAAVIAIVFCTLGIWAGYQLTQKKKASAGAQPTDAFEVSSEAIEKLGITPRELEVLQLIANGHSNQEIAQLLFVSLNTVKTHISNVLSKLNAQRRTQAIQRAKDEGLLP